MMSKIVLDIPDCEWYGCDSVLKPTYGLLCVVIMAYGDREPDIMQYRKADSLCEKYDYFLDVSDKWKLDSADAGEYWVPSTMPMRMISHWKPLGLPQNEDERLHNQIESWFDS